MQRNSSTTFHRSRGYRVEEKVSYAFGNGTETEALEHGLFLTLWIHAHLGQSGAIAALLAIGAQ
jgi:hypothetical protein